MTKGQELYAVSGGAIHDLAGLPIRSKRYVDTERTVYGPTGLKRVITGAPVWAAVGKAGLPFNTSAQLPPDTAQALAEKKFKVTLAKRARSKFVTNMVAVPLASLVSPLENSYKTTLRCSASLTEENGKLTGLYCGQRWCAVCSRIRTARMIQGYLPQLEAMPDKWFVTLTIRNVPELELPETITGMLRTATLINRSLKEKLKLKYSSLRKLECTYNPVARTYHPHFHFIFDSEVAARAYKAQWMARYFGRVDEQGQDVRPADNKSVKELFKYFAKIASGKKFNPKTGKVEDYYIHIRPLDVMFQAMRGKRVFQPCGVVKAVKEEIEPEFALPSARDLSACWSWMGNDWIDRNVGALLTGYEPSAQVKEIASHIVMPARRTQEVLDEETGELVTVPVTRFGQLAATPYSELTHHEYGPHLPRNYVTFVYCPHRVRHWVKILCPPSRTPKLFIRKCKPSTLSPLHKFSILQALRITLPARNGS